MNQVYKIFALLIGVLLTAHVSAQEITKLTNVVSGMPKGGKQEIRVITANLKPGAKTNYHTHPFPVTLYVLKGSFTLELDGHKPITVKAGEAIVEPPNVKMTGYNFSKTEDMDVVTFYVSDPKSPFLEPAH